MPTCARSRPKPKRPIWKRAHGIWSCAFAFFRIWRMPAEFLRRCQDWLAPGGELVDRQPRRQRGIQRAACPPGRRAPRHHAFRRELAAVAGRRLAGRRIHRRARRILPPRAAGLSFSTPWKKVFHTMEKWPPAPRRGRSACARRGPIWCRGWSCRSRRRPWSWPTICRPAFHELLQHVADWQDRYGIVFTMLMRVVFNGLIPAIFCALIPGLRMRRPGAALVFGMVWWAFMGANTHVFYHLPGLAVGFRGQHRHRAAEDRDGHADLFALLCLAHRGDRAPVAGPELLVAAPRACSSGPAGIGAS